MQLNAPYYFRTVQLVHALDRKVKVGTVLSPLADAHTLVNGINFTRECGVDRSELQRDVTLIYQHVCQRNLGVILSLTDRFANKLVTAESDLKTERYLRGTCIEHSFPYLFTALVCNDGCFVINDVGGTNKWTFWFSLKVQRPFSLTRTKLLHP